MRSGLPVILAAAGRIYMHHAVLYRGKAAFNSVVRPLRHRVRLVERGLAVGPDFHVNVYPVPEKARLYLVYSNYAVLLLDYLPYRIRHRIVARL